MFSQSPPSQGEVGIQVMMILLTQSRNEPGHLVFRGFKAQLALEVPTLEGIRSPHSGKKVQ